MRKYLFIGMAGVIAGAMFVPGPNAEAKAVRGAGAGRLEPIVQRACGDCHSNETVWPWYSNFAPASWMLEKDVSEGRKFLNFSNWAAYGAEGQKQLSELAGQQLKSGAMPPDRYLLLHPEAKLNPQDRIELLAALGRMRLEPR